MDFAARWGHPLAGKTGIEMAALKQYGWVLGSENDPQRRYLKGVFASKDMVPPKVTIEVSLEKWRSEQFNAPTC